MDESYHRPSGAEGDARGRVPPVARTDDAETWGLAAPVRTIGAIVTGGAILAVAVIDPVDDRQEAWGLGVLAGLVTLAVVLALVAALRRARRAPGTMSADYLVILAGAVAIPILGWPLADLLGLVDPG